MEDNDSNKELNTRLGANYEMLLDFLITYNT